MLDGIIRNFLLNLNLIATAQTGTKFKVHLHMPQEITQPNGLFSASCKRILKVIILNLKTTF